MSSSVYETDFHSPPPRTAPEGHEKQQLIALKAELIAARTREELLLGEMRAQAMRQELLAQEFEHRLVNGLQLISSLLSMQARAADSPEVTAQLTIASRRVASLGRVHHRLHQSDQQEQVEFGPYLQTLCDDLSSLLFEGGANCSVEVEAASASIPSKLAIPLGFIVNELITNAAKYARGRIDVRFEKAKADYLLSVQDDGPGLPPGFEPSKSKGLGMKIALALVKQVGGELHISPGDEGRGARFTVRFEAAPL